jgi:hypothetical protein
MRKIDRLVTSMREQFPKALAAKFADKYDGKRIETKWNIFHDCYVSTPVYKGAKPTFEFTPEMQAYISGFETAWLLAMDHAFAEY